MYNYVEHVIEDVKRAILDNYTTDEIHDNLANRFEWEEELNVALWTDDTVTGNGSGSYTFSKWHAEENLAHNWDLLEEALDAFGVNENPHPKGTEWCDITIRCYLLGTAISAVLDELEEEYLKPYEEGEGAEGIDD